MGTWGVGLYAGDFAADLRKAIVAVARLPFDGDRLVDVLTGVEPAVAGNPSDSDYTTFWLVVADQLARRGIESPAARARALDIIDSGADLQSLAARGMTAPALEKRRTLLGDVRKRIEAPPARRRGSTLKKPQVFIMAVGDVFTYPTSKGRAINSYFPSKDTIPWGWSADGYAAAVIVDRGHAFDFLAWYRPLVVRVSAAVPWTMGSLGDPALEWVLRRPGTCSAVHFKRLELAAVGHVAIDRERLTAIAGALRPGTSQAINDIGIVNELWTLPVSGEARTLTAAHSNPVVVRGLGAILAP